MRDFMCDPIPFLLASPENRTIAVEEDQQIKKIFCIKFLNISFYILTRRSSFNPCTHSQLPRSTILSFPVW